MSLLPHYNVYKAVMDNDTPLALCKEHRAPCNVLLMSLKQNWSEKVGGILKHQSQAGIHITQLHLRIQYELLQASTSYIPILVDSSLVLLLLSLAL